jgi:hypothetical protein
MMIYTNYTLKKRYFKINFYKQASQIKAIIIYEIDVKICAFIINI